MSKAAEVIADIKALSGQIAEIQEGFDNGKYKGHGKAVELQRLKTRRAKLRGTLEAMRLVWDHPNPESLPPPLKRTRNEVRRMIGLPEIEEINDN